MIRRDRLYPALPKVNEIVFAEALCKYGIAEKNSRALKRKKADTIVVTKDDKNCPDLLRLYKLLYQRLKDHSIVFDPLGKFQNSS